jgi:hypothetical protein
LRCGRNRNAKPECPCAKWNNSQFHS